MRYEEGRGMRYLSVCTGVAPQTKAWSELGWEPVAFSEIEPFLCAVLKHHYPDVPNLGDMTKIRGKDYAGAVDILVGGTPCQSFSVAGLRKGLADPRGNLALEFLRLADEIRPKWVLWENVPGVLSSNEGRDFGAFIGALGQLGFRWAYRILDAQYFGVPQRRRRVFVVASLGNRSPEAVLFEQESLRWNPAPSRETGEEVAGTLKGGSGERGYPDPSDGNGGGLVANCLSARPNASHRADSDNYVPIVSHTLRGEGFDASEDGCGRGTPIVVTGAVSAKWAKGTGGPAGDECQNLICIQDVSASKDQNGLGISEGAMYTLDGRSQHAVCFQQNTRDEVRLLGGDGQIAGALAAEAGMKQQNYVAETLTSSWHRSNGAKAGSNAGMVNPVINTMGVRRLTPRECERLQGFADDYTLVPYNGKPAADGPRYRAIGNSWANPVLVWLAQRINMVEEAINA